jgi:pyruvate dehydrogenase (quinone)
VRHEEYGVFAAVADAYFTGNPVVVCGTAGPGRHASVQRADGRPERRRACHRDCRRRGNQHDGHVALEELNPYKFFDTAALYVGRVVNPEQARAVINTAILTAVIDRGPTVISMPGDVAASDVLSRRS